MATKKTKQLVSNNSIPVGSFVKGNITNKTVKATQSAKKQIRISKIKDQKTPLKLNKITGSKEQISRQNHESLYAAPEMTSFLQNAPTVVATPITTTAEEVTNVATHTTPISAFVSSSNIRQKEEESKKSKANDKISPITTMEAYTPIQASPIVPTPITTIQTISIGGTEIPTGSFIQMSSSTTSAPIMYSSSFVVAGDAYNLDTPETDLRSYSGELLSSFDQLESGYGLELDIIGLIKDTRNNRIVIPFRMGDYDSFYVKVYDMFFDRKVFFGGLTTIDDASNYLQTDFCTSFSCSIPAGTTTNKLNFTREDAKNATTRNKSILLKEGINCDFDYIIVSDSEEKSKKARRLLEIGTFDHYINNEIQINTFFIYKIFGVRTAATFTPIASSTSARPPSTITPIFSRDARLERHA